MKPAARFQSRPLSPHLQIYRLTMTMMMSILHRITGVGLYLGTLLLAWWLIAAALGPNAYAAFVSFVGSPLGEPALLGYTWALIHHMLGGLRHLVWDMGGRLDLPAADFSELKTLDAAELPSAVNTLCKNTLSVKFIQSYDEIRSLRNKIAHLGHLDKQFNPQELLHVLPPRARRATPRR